ncbi:MAG: heavy metal translocating P-type ATPase [Clostridia bacterium]|nr:heavy metal translocating P-type ATPase [Clostridia bacterium]
MRQFDITGMSCAACSARVEKAVSNLPDVSSCSVNLLTNSMAVEGTASAEEIIKAVENAGYGAALKGEKTVKKEDNTEERAVLKRLIASLVLLLPLMYLGMGHMMFGAPLPAFLKENHVLQALLQMILSGAVLLINKKFFVSGAKGVLHGSPNMDTLVSLGSGISFLWSLYILFKMTGAENPGMLMGNLYFESAAMILTLITVGKMLEARSKGKTTSAIKSLADLSPKTARVLREGSETVIPIEDMEEGDVFLVKPGESIPADGMVLDGESAVSEAALTGESVPQDKSAGDKVFAATINSSGFLKCKATHTGDNTTLSQIIKMVTDASATKAPIAKTADKVAGVFVPVVIGVAAVTFAAWLFLGESAAYALKRAISVLVISCPCSLGLATPVAIMVGSGVGAKHGILFKTAESLEETGKVSIAALDKTGTVTEGVPRLTDIIPDKDQDALLKAAVSLESKSEHPLSVAITKYAEENGIEADEVSEFKAVPGNGLSAKIHGIELFGGNLKFLADKTDISADMIRRGEELAEKGETPLYFAADGKFLGIIAVADTVKEDSAEAIAELKDLGIKTHLVTGDNRRTAKAIGDIVCADAIFADVLPGEKEEVIINLQKSGKTLMVGDGINDAVALTRADIGMAIGAGTDVAIDAADVVLMKNSLKDAAASVRLSRATMRNIKQNLFWAFIYNIIGIPLAAGVFKNALGWDINPMFGAAAMSLSSVCVVLNALRLNFAKIYKDNKTEVGMENTVTLNIKGMMCPHCEAAVKGALEAFPEVLKAEASHETGTAVISLKDGNADIEKMKKAVEEKGYEVV